MTGNSKHEKLRALFLAFIMVVSVVGMTAAFAGSAGATVSTWSLGSQDVVEGEGVTISAADDADATTDGTVYVVADKDDDGIFDNGEIIGQSAGTTDTSSQDIATDTTGLSGDVDVYVFEDTAAPTDGTTDLSTYNTGPKTLSVTPLEISITPSETTYGDTVSLTVDVTAGGSAYEKNVHVGVFGLNSDSANADNKVLKAGSTTSGTYSAAVTLNGQDGTHIMGDYQVVVRNDDTGTAFTTGNIAPTTDLDATTLLNAEPDVTTASISDVVRGNSVSASGSITKYDDTGVADYDAQLKNLDDNTLVGTPTQTASNGDFATSVVAYDAAEYAVTVPLYNASTGSVENYEYETFNATSNAMEVTTDVDSVVANIKKSQTITLEATNADAGDNVTRFELSGVALDEVDASDATTGTADATYIDMVVLTDGTTIGEIDGDTEFDNTVADPDGDGTNEIDTANSDSPKDIVTTDNANIETIVLAGGLNDKDVDFQTVPAEDGTLNVDGTVEDTANAPDAANTPLAPDYTGSTSMTVNAPDDLNVLLNPSEADISNGGTIDQTDVTITALDSNGDGLSSAAEGSVADDRIQSVTIKLAGNGTQFGVESTDGTVEGVSVSNTGNNLDSTEVTITNEDVGTDTQDFLLEALEGEQNGTVTVTVTADVKGQNSDITTTETFTFLDSVKVSGVPSDTFTSGTQLDMSMQVTDGDGTPLNNRQIIVGDANADNNLFSVDTNNDGSAEITGVDAIRFDGSANTIEFETGGDGGFNEDSVTTSVNNGQYELNNVNITSAGNTVDVQVQDSGGDVEALFPAQFSTTGQDVYTVTSDVDPMVAGFTEQVNLTVTNSTGAQVTGQDLKDLLNNDLTAGPNPDTGDSITQDGTELAELSGTDTVNVTGDSAVDVIQIDVTPQSTSDINFSVDNGDATMIGSGSVAVVEPEISVNVTDDTFTERLQQPIEVTVQDPRDGSRLTDSDTAPDLRFRAYNGTVEIAQQDGATAVEELDNGEAVSNIAYLNDVSDANQTFVVLPYREDATGPFTIEMSAQSDFTAGGSTDASYFGDKNYTVSPPQVTASPSNITLGSQTTVEVSAEDANGNALADRRVDLVGAGVTITNAGTDSSGYVAVNVNPQATGSIGVFTASDADLVDDNAVNNEEGLAGVTDDDTNEAPGDIANHNANTQEATVNVQTEQKDFDVSVSPTSVTANTSTTVTVTATNNATGDAVEGASVDLSGAGVNMSAQTDANGEASFDVNASQTGTIDVTVDNAGYNAATDSITVNEEADDGDVIVLDDPATNLDDDAQLEDVNGNSEFDIGDVQALYANRDSDAVQNNVEKFDFNDNGGIDIGDVQALYVEYQNSQ